MKTIKVCIGSDCHLKCSDKVNVKASFCLGNCEGAVAVSYDDNMYSLQPATTEEFYNSVIKETI